MPESNPKDWSYLGSSKISETVNRIRLPPSVFDAGILSAGQPAYWSFDSETGIIIISEEPIQNQPFKNVGSRKVGGETDGYRVTIPNLFFEGESENQPLFENIRQPLPDHAKLQRGKEYHFIANEEMINHSPKSCFMISRETLSNIINPAPVIEEGIDRITGQL